jgi:hypothetical protein
MPMEIERQNGQEGRKRIDACSFPGLFVFSCWLVRLAKVASSRGLGELKRLSALTEAWHQHQQHRSSRLHLLYIVRHGKRKCCILDSCIIDSTNAVAARHPACCEGK